MVLIINCSTLSSPGPIQIAVSFLHECLKIPENQYYVFASAALSRCICVRQFPANFHFTVIQHHPAYGFKGFATKRLMRQVEAAVMPDCVFTIFGPGTWKPKAPHLQGFASGHYVYKDSPAYSIMPLKERLHRELLRFVQLYFLKRDGAYYVCETDDVSRRLSKVLRVSPANIFTVSNCYNHFFNDFVPGDRQLPLPLENEFRFLLMSSALPHKNLAILNQVIPILKKKYPRKKISFVVTVSPEDYERLFAPTVRDLIYNYGFTPPERAPELYHETDALFAPTLLECFSAVYPEAMVMQRPIVSTDLSFTRAICGSAAVLYSPLDPEDAAGKLYSVAEDAKLRERLVRAGLDQLKNFETPYSRARKYLEICHRISKK